MAATVEPSGSPTTTVSSCWGCATCRQLYYSENPQKEDKVGSCPGGGVHKLGCGEFKLVDTGSGESGFKFCKGCGCVYLASSATAGTCAGGGSHSPGGAGPFTLSKAARDPNISYGYPWQKCKKCAGIFLSSSGANGTCAKGGNHEAAASEVYSCTKKADAN
jgi:hypothetical protein